MAAPAIGRIVQPPAHPEPAFVQPAFEGSGRLFRQLRFARAARATPRLGRVEAHQPHALAAHADRVTVHHAMGQPALPPATDPARFHPLRLGGKEIGHRDQLGRLPHGDAERDHGKRERGAEGAPCAGEAGGALAPAGLAETGLAEAVRPLPPISGVFPAAARFPTGAQGRYLVGHGRWAVSRLFGPARGCVTGGVGPAAFFAAGPCSTRSIL